MSKTTINLFQPVHLPEMEIAALEVMRSGQIASGPKVAEFEQSFGNLVGREHVVSTNDLTNAVMLALHLVGVRSGDDVATVAFSCLQSNSPIVRLGAHPVWIDIDPLTMSMCVEDLAAKLKPSVKAVIVYHIAGYPADTVRISDLCRNRGIPLIEDCNNAIGAKLDSRHVGTHGDFAVYSFFPNRQINGIEGGMLATPNAKTAERATRLRRFGLNLKTFRDSSGEINPESDVPEIGWSAALNNLNASVALSQLSTLAVRASRTQEIAEHLAKSLVGLDCIRVVKPVERAVPAYWGLLIMLERRDALNKYLKSNGIKSSLIHMRNDYYSGFCTPIADLPGTTIVMDQVLAIPCGWWLTNAQVDEIICRLSTYGKN